MRDALLRAADVHEPVADAVEAAGSQQRVANRRREIRGPPEERAGTFVIPARPEESEIDQALPFRVAVVQSGRRVERALIVGPRGIERAQRLVRLAARPVHACRRAYPEMLRGLDRAREMLDDGARRMERLRALADALRVVVGLLPGVRLVEVMRQIGEMGLERSGVDALHRLADRPVQGSSLPREQLSVDGLLRERVPEGEAIGALLNDKLRADQLLDHPQKLPFLEIRQAQQQREVEAPAGDRRKYEDSPLLVAKFIHALAHRILDTARDVKFVDRLVLPRPVHKEDLAGRDKRFQYLFDEKRIALGERIDGVEGLRPDGRAEVEDRRDHLSHLPLIEGRQRPLDHQTFAVETGKQAAQRRLHLVAPVGQNEQRAQIRQPSREVQQELKARFVAPVQVFDHDQQRSRRRDACEQLRERGEEAAFVLFRLGRRRAARDLVGAQCGENLRKVAGLGSCPGCQVVARNRPQQVEERPVGEGVVRLEAMAAQHLHRDVRGLRPANDLADEPRLPDSRFAGDRDHLAVTVEGVRDQTFERLDIKLPADDDRTHDRCISRGSRHRSLPRADASGPLSARGRRRRNRRVRSPAMLSLRRFR